MQQVIKKRLYQHSLYRQHSLFIYISHSLYPRIISHNASRSWSLKGGHGLRRSLRKLRKLGMRVRQFVLSCARSS